jgi:glycosyltransferase involved in cell wall biosynthesis
MKILMVGNLPLEIEAVKGGVEAVIVNLFAGFSTLDNFELIHVAFSREVNETRVVQYAPNIKILYLPFVTKVDILDYYQNRNAFRQILDQEKPDLIHIQEITPHLLRFLNLPNTDLVVTQHGVMKEELKYATGVGQKLKCIFKAAIEKYVFPRFRNIIFISEYNKALFPYKNIISQRIYNPVNPKFFAASGTTPKKRNTLMYVGVLSRRKNFKLVVEALGLLKKKGISFDLHVVGGFKDTGYQAEVMNVVRINQLEGQVVFHGWKPQPEIARLYSHCTYFILPSLQETLPVSIAEAMAAGKIVIASDVGAISEMFVDGQTGYLFRKNDLADLVRVLETVDEIESPELRAERVKNEALSKFHPTLIAKQTRDFYQQVINNKPSH